MKCDNPECPNEAKLMSVCSYCIASGWHYCDDYRSGCSNWVHPSKKYCEKHSWPYKPENEPLRGAETVNPDTKHYTQLKPEPVEVMEAWGLTSCYYKSTALKYLARAGRKDGNTEAQDLRKAIDFLSRRVNQLEGKKGWKL